MVSGTNRIMKVVTFPLSKARYIRLEAITAVDVVSGIYFYKLLVGRNLATSHKMTLLR
jgi:hypothetical protein